MCDWTDSPCSRNFGFTLLEPVLVIAILGILAALVVPCIVYLSADASYAATRNQAAQLVARDMLNVSACAVGHSAYVDITTSGKLVCRQALTTFMPELDLSVYEVRNIPSKIPQAQWESYLLPGEALFWFWVTRYLRTPPPPSWLAAGWNVRQPCILRRR